MAITETRVLPPEFIEAAGKTYLGDLATATGQFKTADLSKVFGQQFVAGQDPLQAQAQQTLATQGIGAYKPFLQSASALAGPTAFRQFMSPYQQDVIDTTLKEFDTQAAKGLPALAAQAINAGAFGGGREGVQRAEYQQASDRNRAALQAQLLQQGFGQAQQLAQQALRNQLNLAGPTTSFLRSRCWSVIYSWCTEPSVTASSITSTTTVGSTTITTTINCGSDLWSRSYKFNRWISRSNNSNKST
jgi:hypothetical protein